MKLKESTKQEILAKAKLFNEAEVTQEELGKYTEHLNQLKNSYKKFTMTLFCIPLFWPVIPIVWWLPDPSMPHKLKYQITYIEELITQIQLLS